MSALTFRKRLIFRHFLPIGRTLFIQKSVTLGPDSLQGAYGQALTTGLNRLASRDVDVILSPALPDFLSTPTYREWITHAWDTAAFVERENLTNVRGLIGDSEHPLVGPFDWLGLEGGRVTEMAQALAGFIQQSRQRYPDLQIGVTASWLLYVDGVDGDADLAVTFRSPVDPPGSWSFINQMTYSSYLPSAWRAYYVYRLETALSRRYPNADMSHLIGLVGGGFPWEPLLDFDDLAHDAILSRALGVREIVVFQLNGALEVFGDSFVRRLTEAVNASSGEIVVPFSRPASMALFGVAADAALDVRGWGGVIWLGWVGVSAWLVRQR